MVRSATILGSDAEAPLKLVGVTVLSASIAPAILGSDAEAPLKLGKQEVRLLSQGPILGSDAEAPLKHAA